MEVGFPPGPLQVADEVGGVEFVEGQSDVDLVGFGGAGEQTDGDAHPSELVHDRGGQPADAAHTALRAGEAHTGDPRVGFDVEPGRGRSEADLTAVAAAGPDPYLSGGGATGDRSASGSLQVGG